MRGWPQDSPIPQHPVGRRHMFNNSLVGHNIRPNMENQFRIDENYGHPSNNNVYNTRVGMKHAKDAMNSMQNMQFIENARGYSMAGMQHMGSVDNRYRQYDDQWPPIGGGNINERTLDRDPNFPTAFRSVNAEKPLVHFADRPMDNNMRPNGNRPNDSIVKYIEHSMLSANNLVMLPDDNMRNMTNLLPGSYERTSRGEIELRALLESNNPRQMGHALRTARNHPTETFVHPMDGNARQANVTQSLENILLSPENNTRPPDNDMRRIENVPHLDPMQPAGDEFRPAKASAQSMNVSLMRGDLSHSMQAQNIIEAAVGKSRDNPRDARNKAEKQRRDKLNGSINELASLVPLVAESSRKIDKTGVLRLTAHDLRKEHVFGNSMAPCHLNMKPKLAEAFIDMMGGCLLTTTCRGIIIVISANVEHYLGHLQTDLLGMNILNLCHPEDLEKLKANLMPHATPMGPNGQLLITDMDSNVFTANEKPRHFQVRLARAVQRSEAPQYEVCRFNGSLRFADRANVSGAGTGQIVRRHRARGDESISPSGNDVVFIGMIHIVKQTYLSERLIEASKQEYRTRHLIDGRIVQCDQRISVVAGYLTSEISGVSAFTFMHKEDVRFVIIALRQMYDRSKQYGESCYRLMSRTGEFIYLRTTGYLEISSDNAVQSFVCMNSRIPEEKGRELIEDMKEKYSVIFNGIDENFPYGSSGESTVEDPQKLEQVIMHLITNLPSPSSLRFPSPDPSSPLSIIPPKPCTIKSSIAKSVSVISQAIKMKGSDSGSIVKPGFKPESMYTPSELIALKASRSAMEHKNKLLFPTKPEKRVVMKEEIILNKESLIQRNLLASEDSLEEKILNKNCPNDTVNVKKESPQTTAVNSIENPVKTSVEDVCLPTSSPKVYHTFSSDVKPTFPQIYINTESFALPPAPNQRTLEKMLQTPIITLETQTSEKAITEMIPDLNSYVNSVYGMNIFVADAGDLIDKDNLQTVDCEDLLIDSDMKPETLSSANVLLSSLNVLDPAFCLAETLASTSYVGNLGQLKRSHNAETEFDTIPKRRMQSSSAAGTSMSSESDSSIKGPTQTQQDRQSQQGLDCYIQQLNDPNSDLDTLVPRSLAALESSITLIDGTVHQLTQFENMPQTTISDIIMEHQAHKELLESIQLDHRNRQSDGSPTDDEPSPAPCLDN